MSTYHRRRRRQRRVPYPKWSCFLTLAVLAALVWLAIVVSMTR